MSRPTGSDYADLAMPGYRNINEFWIQSDRLHGTETLMGDWNGETLVVGQDFCHAQEIENRMTDFPDRNPFHHGKIPTNKKLVELLNPYLDHKVSIHQPMDQISEASRHCGALYGNIVWLLKNTPRIDGTLTNVRDVIRSSRPIMQATVQAMPNLKRVLCLGQVAYEGFTRNILNIERSWRADLDANFTLNVNGWRVVATAHRTANRVNGNTPTGITRRQLIQNDVRRCFE